MSDLSHDSAEKAIIASALEYTGKTLSLADTLGVTSACFSDVIHGAIWDMIVKLHAASKDVDIITVRDQMFGTIAGKEPIEKYGQDVIISESGIFSYLHIVRERYSKDQIKHELDEAKNKLYSTESAEEIISGITLNLSKLTTTSKSTTTIGDSVSSLMTALRKGRGKNHAGLPSRWTALQHVTGGYRKGKTTIVAGRPGNGKSTFMSNEAVHKAMVGHPTAVASLEMTKDEIVHRIICEQADLDSFTFDIGIDSDEDLALYEATAKKIAGLPLYISDEPMNIERLCSWMRDMVVSNRVEFIAIDYLQLLEDSKQAMGRSPNYEVARWSKNIVNTTKSTGASTLLLSQLSRAVEREDRPRLHHLRDSGALEQDMYMVLLLSEDPENKAVTICDVAKNRGGRRGDVLMNFVKDRQKFKEYIHSRPVQAG